MEGNVKFFNGKKRFGFIQGDDGTSYFVHKGALAEGTYLREGDRVAFTPQEGERGPIAEEVKLLKKASEMDSGDEGSNELPEDDEVPSLDDSPEEPSVVEPKPSEESLEEVEPEEKPESSEE